MTVAAQTFRQEVFEFIEDLDHQSDPNAVMAVMSRVVARFGFEGLFVSWLRASPSQPYDDLYLRPNALANFEPSTPAGVTSDSIQTFSVPLAQHGLLNGVCRPVKARRARNTVLGRLCDSLPTLASNGALSCRSIMPMGLKLASGW